MIPELRAVDVHGMVDGRVNRDDIGAAPAIASGSRPNTSPSKTENPVHAVCPNRGAQRNMDLLEKSHA